MRAEQRLRNELGAITHRNIKLGHQVKEMQSDLIRQRQDMKDAIDALGRGEIKAAIEALQGGLDYRLATRKQRNVSA